MKKYLISLSLMVIFILIFIPSSFAEDSELQITNDFNVSNNITYDYYLISEDDEFDNYLIKSSNGSLLLDNVNNPYKIVNYSTKGGPYYIHLDLRNIINELNITGNVTFKLLGNDWVTFMDDGNVKIPAVHTGSPPYDDETNNEVKINNAVHANVNYDFKNASNLTKYYGENQSFQGFVDLTKITENENVESMEILVLISRLSTGASKFYHIPVNWDGYFELPINLAPGNYHVIIPRFFNIGGGNLLTDSVHFYSIFILNPNENQTQTFLDYNENSFFYGFKGEKLVGTLKTQDNKFLSNQIVEIEITRNSNGASKTYFVLTNVNGEYDLPINLAENGSYTFKCAYKGTSEYKGSSYMLTKSFD